MGYYTYYDGIAYDKDFKQIDFENPNSNTLDIIKTLANFMHDEYPCDTIEELSDVIIEIFNNGSGDLKWYDYENHMKKLAECFPDYKFEIEGLEKREETGGYINFGEIRIAKYFAFLLKQIFFKKI